MTCAMATATAPVDSAPWALWETVRDAAFEPPPSLSVSEWADAYRVVPSYSSDPGRWVTDKTPYLREIMDSFNSAGVNKVVLMKCSRIGATEAGLNVVGFYIAQEPSPVFIVQPTVEDAKDFSKEQLTPTIEMTECLRQRVSESTSRDSKNTIQAKVFDGGALYLVGANSPRGFRRRTARVIVLEEVDAYPPSAGTEGDQVKLAERRATTYQHRRKVYINSSPTLTGASRIEAEFKLSDQRRYHVPCPDCGHVQHLVWGQVRYKDLEAPHYCCIGCGVLIPEAQKFRMVHLGQWIAGNPGPRTRGYHINALYSPWVSWQELVDEWLEAQGDVAKLQVFVNTALGETWEDRGGGLDATGLMANRRESYAAEVPQPVGLLTCGIDVQHDRIEAIVRGWGVAEESWLIERQVWLCDPSTLSAWDSVDAYLLRDFKREDGALLRIHTTCVDSGDNTQTVYQFCKPRYARRVFATKGAGQAGKPFLPRRPTYNNKVRCALFFLGVNAGKAMLYGRLKILGEHAGARAPYKYHFPMSADRDYFEQLVAEVARRKLVGGTWVTAYENPRQARNEVMDCEVLALAALYLSNQREHLGTLATARATPDAEPAVAVPALAPVVRPAVGHAPKRRHGGSWITRGV